MGCSSSLENKKIACSSSVYGSRSIALSPKQKKIVQSTWLLLEPKKNELGVQIFLSLFEAIPSLQQVFPEFRNVKLETLKTERSLHGHTKRVMKVVENAVTSLEDPDSMIEYLLELGRRHRYRQIKPKPLHLEEICKCIKTTFMVYLGSEWTTDVAESWNIFLDSVISLIKEGLHRT
uniref:Globin-like protein n=1 Tax=Actinia tenebrosa TaxID=6105 RepID=A0A2K9UYQ0_ACTTE|nr:globin-like protein [Actinia tenebrosa]